MGILTSALGTVSCSFAGPDVRLLVLSLNNDPQRNPRRRGRIIPTTPWEAVWSAVAGWLGVTDKAALDKLLPHAKNFKTGIFKQSDLFKS